MADLQSQELADPDVRALALKVRCLPDPDSAFPRYFSGGVSVTLRDGRVFKEYVRVNSGAGDRAMRPEAVVDKFMASATLTIPARQAEQIREAVLALEQISAADLAALLRANH
jgi:2-methylcitrate dehydratase PrpD